MEKAPSKDQIMQEIDTEVHRVARSFQFILKYKEHFQSSGIEFSDLREYRPTDDSSRIDWKSSARLTDLYVKEFDEEKDLDVFIILDASKTMTFGTAEKLKSQYSALMAATLSYASVNSGIDVGIAIFGKNKKIINPSSGESQYLKILSEVSNPENYGGKFDLKDALKSINQAIKEKTFIFLITDFIDVDDNWKNEMSASSSKFRHFLSIMVRDLRDYKLPDAGNFRFKSPDGGQMMVVNTSKKREEYNKEASIQEKKIEDQVVDSGAEFMKLDTRDSFAAGFMNHFEESDKW